MNILFGVIVVLTGLGIWLNSWIALAVIVAVIIAYLYLLSFNRLYPEHEPEPSAADLVRLIEEHKEQVNRDLDNLRGKLELRHQRQGLRE